MSKKQRLSLYSVRFEDEGIQFKKDWNIKNIQNENERKMKKKRDIIKNRLKYKNEYMT